MVKDNYAMDTKDEDIVGQPNPVDIYVGSHSEALNSGMYYAEVRVVG